MLKSKMFVEYMTLRKFYILDIEEGAPILRRRMRRSIPLIENAHKGEYEIMCGTNLRSVNGRGWFICDKLDRIICTGKDGLPIDVNILNREGGKYLIDMLCKDTQYREGITFKGISTYLEVTMTDKTYYLDMFYNNVDGGYRSNVSMYNRFYGYKNSCVMPSDFKKEFIQDGLDLDNSLYMIDTIKDYFNLYESKVRGYLVKHIRRYGD